VALLANDLGSARPFIALPGTSPPYSDGEKDTALDDFANHQRSRTSAKFAAGCPADRWVTE
jgi:hypothetical protein